MLLSELALSQPIVETIPDGTVDDRDDGRKRVIVLVQTVQQALHPPNVYKERYKQGSPVLEAWADPSVWELIALQPGNVIPIRKTEENSPGMSSFAELVGGFDFFAAVEEILDSIDTDTAWIAQSMHEFDFVDERGTWEPERVRREGFLDGHRHPFVMMRFWYFMSPDLASVRLVVQLRMYVARRSKYPRDGNRSIIVGYAEQFRRTYEYLSPPLTPAISTWAPGQKERLLDALQIVHDQRTATYPINERTYRKEHERAVRILNSRDHMLMADFMLESWSFIELASALDTATKKMTNMLQFDLRSLPPESYYHDGRPEEFQALTPSGKPKQYRGKFLLRDVPNSVYHL